MIQILNILFGAILSLVEAIFTSFINLAVSAVPSKRKHEYDADFEDPGTHLNHNSECPGFFIGTYSNTLKESNSHMICIGGSGSHKSTTICFNILLQARETSFVVHDCSGELYEGCASSLHRDGYVIKTLNCSNTITEGFNFIEKSKTVEDLAKNMNVAFVNSLPNENDYWRQSAESTCLLFAKVLWKYAPVENKNMANLVHIVTTFSYAPEKTDKWILSTRDEQLITEYKSLCCTPQKTIQCTLSTLKNALSIYQSENIQRLTSFDTIDFESFRKQKTALFLLNSPATAYTYRSINATFIQCFFNHILEQRPSHSDLNIMFILDECAVMKIPALSQFLALSRKYKISVATLWQDFEMIESVYGKFEASNIMSNSNLKAWMPCSKPLSTCVMLQNLMGKFHFTDESDIQRTRELMTAQEIYQTDRIIVLNKNNKPVLLKPEPYFSIPRLRKLTEYPPVQLTATLPTEPVPLLKL